jgi:hypothetical protein
MVRPLVLCVVIAACRIHDVDLTGKSCPCPADWFCNTATNSCTRTDVDAANPDTPTLLTYRAAVIADAPIAYWRLDDTGLVARDEMAHFDGTYTGTCTHGVAGALAGDPSPATQFDGASCLITMPDALGFPGTAPYSVEAWFEEAAAVIGFRVVFAKEARVVGPTDGYALVDSGTGVYFERGVNKVVPTTAHVLHAVGQYVHVVGVYDGASYVLYVDAVPGPAVPDTRTMATYSANPLIGANPTSDYFIGMLDEIAVYDHALSAARIALHHDLGVSGPRQAAVQ